MNLNYHVHKSNIICPYCDKDCRDDDNIVIRNSCEKVEFECEHCGKKFWAKSSIVYSTDSDCKLNNELHIWEKSIKYPAFFGCKNCSQWYVKTEENKHGNRTNRV